jgi:hypothetical protein
MESSKREKGPESEGREVGNKGILRGIAVLNCWANVHSSRDLVWRDLLYVKSGAVSVLASITIEGAMRGSEGV